MKKILSIVLSLIMVIGLLSGCAGSGSGNATTAANTEEDTTVAAESNESESNEEESTEAEAVATVQRDVVNIGVQNDLTTFFPWVSGNAGFNESVWGIYECLAEFDNGKYLPQLAKSWELSDDLMTIDVEIYDNIYDSAGNHMTVDDCLFSEEKCQEYIGAEQKAMLESTEKVDDYHFIWHLKAPLQVGGLKVLLTYFRVTKAAFESTGADEMVTTPIGTGPYVLAEHVDGYSFTFKKNEDYWQKDESLRIDRSKANVDTINYFVISESSQRTVALQEGKIDACASVSADDLDKFDGVNGFHLEKVPSNTSLNLLPNFSEGNICTDANLRKAIFYAFDNSVILSSVYGGNGLQMYETAPSWVVDYNTDWETEDNYYQYDPDKAKEFLAQSNYNNETLRLLCPADSASKDTAQIIKSFLENVGINCEISPYEGAVFNEMIEDPSAWDLMIKSYPSTTGYFSQTCHSTLSQTRYAWGGGANFIVDDKLQELIDTCMAEGATAEQTDELHDYIIDNAVIKGIVNPTTIFVVRDFFTSVCTNQRKGIYAGGCTYSE